MWTLLFSSLNKCVALGSQIALARLLVPEHFGLVAMALSVTSFAAIFSGSTLRTVLVQRMERFDEDAPQAFWFALALNVSGALLIAVAAPLAGIVFSESRVVPLILVIALAAPLQALPTIYSAALFGRLRFREAAMIHFGAGLTQNVSSVTLAWLGFGAFSLVLPLLLMAAFMALAFRLTAGRIPLGWPHPGHWRKMRGAVGWLMINALFASLQTFGANFVISLTHNAVVTGYFYWGVAVSGQLVFLLATNLQQVLMPVFARLKDDSARQWIAVSKAVRTLLALVAPVCLLQVLLAEPVITLVFHDRWLPSVPVVQFISLAMVTQPLNLLMVSALTARGRFKALAFATASVVLALVIAAGMGSQWGQQSEIAACVAVAMVLGNLFAGWMAFREFGRGWIELFQVVAPIASISAAAGGFAWWLRDVTAPLGVPAMALTTVTGCGVSYFIMLRLLHDEVLDDVWARFTRRRHRNSPPASQ
jgi:O-antigen/teichoic acid export membrane protein